MTLHFVVPGKPQAWQRIDRGRYGQGYVPAETLAFERDVWVCALKAGARQLMFEGRPVVLTVRSFLHPKVKKPRSPIAPLHAREGGDADNYGKCVMDGLKPLWIDDGQVIDLIYQKRYGDPERTEVTITDDIP